jgi:hypothetical protein
MSQFERTYSEMEAERRRFQRMLLVREVMIGLACIIGAFAIAYAVIMLAVRP